jgi:hypothetical protein
MKQLELTVEERKIIDNAITNILNCKVEQTVVRNIEDKDYMHPEEWFAKSKIGNYNMYGTCGATKLVFLIDDLDNWVIKVPFLFSPTNAPGRMTIMNYCEAEAQVYEMAWEAGKGAYFAPCYFYKTERDIPFYLQRRVECDENNNGDIFYRYCATSYDKEDFETEDEYWESVSDDVDYMADEDRLYAVFGFEEGNELFDFLEAHEINDIHAGNFGFYQHNPVLIDYSGY